MSRRSFWRWVLCLPLALAAIGASTGCRKQAPINTTTPIWQNVPVLMQRLDSQDATDRAAAAEYLGNLGSEAEQALPKLQQLAQNDPNEVVKKAAADAVAKIQGN